MKKTIKPFDIEAAKNGEKVECRDGSEVEILKWNAKGDYPILGVIKRNDGSEMIGHWAIYKKWNTTSEPFDEELVIVEYEDEEDK